jgi:predicted nucleic-acid-binding Zn-ribbon protein
MKNGICPKCGSEEVCINSTASTTNSNTIPITLFYWTRFAFYVCIDCGYVESYINDEKGQDRIAENWPRVIEQKKKREE